MTHLTYASVQAALRQDTQVLAQGLDLKTLTNPDLQAVAIKFFNTVKGDDENRPDFLAFLMDLDTLCSKYASKAPSDKAVEDFLEDVGNMRRKDAQPAPAGGTRRPRRAAKAPPQPPADVEADEGEGDDGDLDLETVV